MSGHRDRLEDGGGLLVQEDTADPSHLCLPHPGYLHVDSPVTTDQRPEILNCPVPPCSIMTAIIKYLSFLNKISASFSI